MQLKREMAIELGDVGNSFYCILNHLTVRIIVLRL